MLAHRQDPQPDTGRLELLPQTASRRPRAVAIKRLMDLTAALLLAPFALTILGSAALLVVLVDRQMPFYLDTRIGRNGKKFRCWKLRTMRADKGLLEAYFLAHPGSRESYEQTRKLDDDPRRTALGSLLRRTSIDELPQLFNVLIGQMSLVGPRPLSPSEFVQRGQHRFLLATVKPGLTGLWQVSGRSDLDLASRIMMDNHYAQHWSLWLDLKLLVATPIAVLTCRGAR